MLPELAHSFQNRLLFISNSMIVIDRVHSVATNYILTEDERARMNAALELIEEALDSRDEEEHEDCSMGNIEIDDDDDDIIDDAETIHTCESGMSHHEIRYEEKREALFRAAISIQESVVGFYHPDVANTYHVYGWFLYEASRPAFALVYFMRAFRICHRLFGNDHTSTKVLLDDIRFLVHEQDASSVEEDCYAIFDSWTCQNNAEKALLVNNNPVAAVGWYRAALRLLPTRTIPTVPFPCDDIYSTRDSEPLCLAELERAIVHLHIAVILQAVLPESTENTQQTCWSNGNNNRNHTLTEAADLYCRALSVLPRWFDEDHPTLLQTRQDASRVILDAALTEEEIRRLKARWIRWTSW